MPRQVLVVIAGVLAAVLICLAISSVAVPLYAHENLARNVGAYAPIYLFEPSPYDRIVVEVHYEESARPSEAALGHLRAVLEKATCKTVVVNEYADIRPGEVPSSVPAGNVSQLGSRLVSNHAIAHTGLFGGDAVMYVLYVNASAPEPKLSKGNRVGGVSYRGDSFVIFKNNLRDDDEEKTVLIHEAGHLLGLDHDDNQSCAMVGSLVRVHRQNYTAPPPDDYCADHWKQIEEGRHSLPLGELFTLAGLPTAAAIEVAVPETCNESTTSAGIPG